MKEIIKRADFEGFIDHPGSGAVIGLKNEHVLLVRIQREGFPFETYEIPGGVAEENETHEQAARREFLEETGYALDYTFHLNTIRPSVGYSNERISVYIGQINKHVQEGEYDFAFCSKKEVNGLIEKGLIIDAMTLGALSIWLSKEELKIGKPHLLFLCTGNYYRSRFAEYYFNFLTNDQFQVDSKGFYAWKKSNEGMISPYTLDYCAELDVPVRKIKFPDQVETYHLEQAERIIIMDKKEHKPMMESLFPDFSERVTYWNIEDIQFQSAASQLPHLKELVEELANSFIK